jgi:hypothetical protein
VGEDEGEGGNLNVSSRLNFKIFNQNFILGFHPHPHLLPSREKESYNPFY